jgi:serine protease AprX
MQRLASALIFFLAASVPAVSHAQGQGAARSSKVDRVLANPSQLPAQVPVIVRHKLGAHGRVSQRVAGNGGRLLRQHAGIGALTITVPRAAVARLAADPDVLSLSFDSLVEPDQLSLLSSTTSTLTSTTSTTTSTTSSTTSTSTSSGTVDSQTILSGSALTTTVSSLLSLFDAQALRATLGVTSTNTGAGVGVAIIDSGIKASTDLQGRITAFYDFTQGTPVAAYPSDGYGHGTHIAGLIAGNGQLSKTKYLGVATGVRLIGLKVLNSQGSGRSSDVIAALEFAIANKAALGIDVINLSLGHPIYEPVATDPMVQAVEHAVRAGIVVVVSAGNHGMNASTGAIGYAGITSPGNAPSALTVGSLRTKATATRADDEVSPFSSRGPTWYDGLVKPDILAPGQALVAISDVSTTLYQNLALRADVAPYLKLSGTSMAAGTASGVVALVIEANRKDEGAASVLTPNMVKAILQYTAIPVADPDPSTPSSLEQGAGGINAAGAVELARIIDPSMPLNTSWLESGLHPFTTIAGVAVSWAQRIIWGDHLVWGDTVSWNLPAWAQHLVWGDMDDDGHIVWGDDDEHIVWGDSFTHALSAVQQGFLAWSTHLVWGDDDEHIVWGDTDGHIVWGDVDDEHIVWGDSSDQVFSEATSGNVEN